MLEYEKDSQLKTKFEQAYKNWLDAPTWQEKEYLWIEYCSIRDLYLGLSFDHFNWQNIKNNEPQ